MMRVPSSRVELYEAIRECVLATHEEGVCIDASLVKDYTQNTVWGRDEFLCLVDQCISALEGVSVMQPLIGLYLDNSVLYLASVVACLAKDCAFVPLHARHSKNRLRLMVQELRPSVVIVADRDVPGGMGASMFDDLNCHVLHVSRQGHGAGLVFRMQQREIEICDPYIEKETVYVLYTSGTMSGDARKPVYGSVCELVNRVTWQASEMPWRQRGDVVSFHTPTCFVDHIVQVFGPLLAENVLVLCVPIDVYLHPLRLVCLLKTYSVTHVTLTPTMWRIVLGTVENVKVYLKSVRVAISSGEVLWSDLLRRMQQVLVHRILNLYGTTASGGDCAFFDCACVDIKPEESVCIPVGKPLPGFSIKVDDDGVVCIRWRDTCEYPGDVGYFDAQSNLVITGRSGGRQKVHGEFVDFDALKNSIKTRVDGVLDVMFVPLAEASQVACFVFWKKSVLEFAQIRTQCRSIIGPGSSVMIMDGTVDVPMNSSGKMDAQALEQLVEQHTKADENRGISEKAVMEILSQFLNVPIGCFEPTDSIFDLGATSSMAVAIAEKLNLPVDEVYYHRHTARDLARHTKKRKIVHNTPHGMPVEKHMAWSREMGSCVDAPSCLTDDGTVLCCSHEGRLDAFASESLDGVFTSYIQDRISAALVELEGVIVVPGSSFGVTLVCARTGKILHTHELNIGARVSPCIVDSQVYFGTYNGSVAVFDVRKPDHMAEFQLGASGPIACSLECCPGVECCVAATIKGEVIAFKPNKHKEKVHRMCLLQTVWSRSVEDAVFAKPLYIKSWRDCVFVASLHGHLRCFDLQTGVIMFQKEPGDSSLRFFMDPLLYKNENIIAVSQTGIVVVVNLALNSVHSIPLFSSVDDIQVYSTCLFPPLDILFVSCSDNSVRIVKLTESKACFIAEEEACIHMPQSVHSLKVSESGVGYFGCRDNYLYCVDIKRVTKRTM